MRRQQAHMMLDMLLNFGERLCPPEAATHFRAARKETLRGIKAMVDSALARLDAEEPAPEQTQEAGPQRIPIE